MPDFPTLNRAPIVEAILDIRVSFSDEPDIAVLESVRKGLENEFPRIEKRIQYHFGAQPGKGENAPEVTIPQGGASGFLFKSEDGKDVLQARRDGFALSRLAPYGDGDTFRRNARRLWEHYAAITRPARITRLALRNINRLELPRPFDDFKEYLLTVPEVAPGLPQGLAGFFYRVVLPKPEEPFPDKPMIAVIASKMEEPDETKVPVIFDIDVFQEVGLPADSQAVWDILGEIRQYRNQIFFGSITDKARRLFE